MVYLHVTLDIKTGKLRHFAEAFERRISVLESFGWKFLGGWQSITGRRNTVVHMWELPDADALPAAVARAYEDAEFMRVAPAIHDCLEREVIQIMAKTPYSP